ncbi:MAG: hypothetical protein ACUVQG_00205 [Thermogutta sp.]
MAQKVAGTRVFQDNSGTREHRKSLFSYLRFQSAGRSLVILLVLTALLLKAGCRKAGSPPALEEVEPLPSQTVEAPPPTVEPPVLSPLAPMTLKPGESATCELSVDRRSLTGPINVQVQNLPPGVSAKAAEIPEGQSKGQLTITADESLGENEISAAATVQIEVAGQRASQPLMLTIPRVPLPEIAVPDSVFVFPGAKVAIDVTFQREGVILPLELRLEKLPEGLSCSPVQVPGDAAKATLEVTATGQATEGDHQAQVVAAVGKRTMSKPVTVVVRKTLFSVQCFRVVTLKPGETQDVDISVTRRGYNGPIQLAFENLPDGVSLTANPLAEGANSVRFHFVVNPDAHERVRSVYVRATGGGYTFRDAIVVRVSRQEGTGFLPKELGYDPQFAPLFRRGSFGGRLSAKSKAALCDAYGGTPESENAVFRGLAWLAAHQEADGRWSLKDYGRTIPTCDCHLDAEKEKEIVDSDTAGTALALLPFLGAGITPENAPEEPAELARYRNGVRRGLWYLMRIQVADPKSDKDGYLGGNTYAHAIGTMALCEAYGLTGDERLQMAAQRAIKYLMSAQHKEGGWRYGFREAGDMSVVGWVFLAIRSGQLAGLKINESPLVRAERFLDTCGVGPEPYKLSEYCYQPGGEPKISLTACGLLTRQYLGWKKDNVHLLAGVKKIMTQLPPAGGQSLGSLYYYYYATQVLHHMEGEEWDLWNHRMREHLIRTQEKSGHRAGSWSPEGCDWGHRGGRIYATSLALMILQEYYRHLPLYRPVPRMQLTGAPNP